MFRIDNAAVRDLMFSKALSIRQLAARAGVMADTVSRILQAPRKANPATIGKLAKALGVKGEKLILKGD